jgi:putative FmdB family regulatory protein
MTRGKDVLFRYNRYLFRSSEALVPIYEYRCSSCGFQKDYLRKVSDPLLSVCPECNQATFGKMLTAAGFQLKGGGWYATDFKHSGTKLGAANGGKNGGKNGDSSKSETSAESKSETKTDAAPAPAAAPAAPAASAAKAE